MRTNFVHCSTCSRAFDVSRQSGCPRCRAREPLEDRVVAALDRAAAAISGAGREERLALAARLERELAAAGDDSWKRALLATVQGRLAAPTALSAAAPAPLARRPDRDVYQNTLVGAFVLAVLYRLAAPARGLWRPGPGLGRRAFGLARRALGSF